MGKLNTNLFTSLFFIVFFSIPLQASKIDSLTNVFYASPDTSIASSFLLGELYFKEQSNLDSLFYYSNHALKLAKKKNLKKDIAKAKIFLSDYQRRIKGYEESKKLGEEALQIYESLKDTFNMAVALGKIGAVYDRLKEYGTALDYFLKAVNYYELTGDLSEIAYSYQSIGTVFARQEDYEQALIYRKKAWGFGKIHSNPFHQTYILAGLAGAFGELSYEIPHYLDSCILYTNMGLELAQKNNFLDRELRFLSIQVGINNAKGNFEEALDFTQQIIDRSHEDQLLVRCEAFYKTADALIGLKRFEEAIPPCDSSMKYALLYGSDYYRMVIYERYFDIYENLNNYKLAYENYKSFKTLEDTIVNIEKTEAINFLEKQFQTGQKEKEILALKLDSELKDQAIRKWTTAFVVILLVLLLIGMLIYFMYAQNLLRTQKKVAEIKGRLLLTQLNPHFFFNSLASLQTLILTEKDNKKSVLYLSKLSKLMRMVLEHSHESFIPLEEELDTLQNYLELQRIRFNKGFEYEINCDEELTEKFSIPPMFAQPFIENALEHGLANQTKTGKLWIDFNKKSNDEIEFSVRDNGIGLTSALSFKKSKNKYKSRATQIIRDRLFLLNQNRKNPLKMTIEDWKDAAQQTIGTKVLIDLPVMYYR